MRHFVWAILAPALGVPSWVLPFFPFCLPCLRSLSPSLSPLSLPRWVRERARCLRLGGCGPRLLRKLPGVSHRRCRATFHFADMLAGWRSPRLAGVAAISAIIPARSEKVSFRP